MTPLIFNINNNAILHKCAINRLIYPLCIYIKNTPEVPTVSLPPLMSPINNDGDTTNRKDFNEPIQYVNDYINNHPMPFTTGVYNQEPITYKHPYYKFNNLCNLMILFKIYFVCTSNNFTIYQFKICK